VDLVAALLEPVGHLLEPVHVLGRRDEPHVGVLLRRGELLVERVLHDREGVDVREQGHVDDAVGLLHRRVTEVDEHVGPAHQVRVEVAGAVTGLSGQHEGHVVGRHLAEVVGDLRAAALEPLGELEADLRGVALLDRLQDPIEFVVPLAVVLQGHPRLREVALRGAAHVERIVRQDG
jgi:hypothetical protein